MPPQVLWLQLILAVINVFAIDNERSSLIIALLYKIKLIICITYYFSAT